MYSVLLVDDEEMVTQGLSRFVPWADIGYEVAGTATSVARALTFLENHPVDLVITDIQMPIQNGIDLLRILKEQYPKIKTIILSGYSEFSYAQQALRLGALDYLTKPVNFGAMKQLLEKVRGILDEENKHSNSDDDIQEMLALTLIMNFINGYPYDEERAAVCLDVTAPIAVIHMISKGKTALADDLIDTFRQTFHPCRIMSPSKHEFLAVLERPQAAPDLHTQLDSFIAQHSGPIQLCAGVSETQPGYAQLRLAAKQASKAMHYQNARSSAGVTFYEQVKQIFLSTGERNPKEEAGIRDLVEMLSVAEKRPQILPLFTSTLYAVANRQNSSIIQAQRFCTELLVEIDASIQNLMLPDYPRHVLLSEALIEVLAAGSLSEINAYMTQYLQQLLERLQQLDETRMAGELIDRVKSYIGTHFAENLTLSVLAEIFYVSPVYLSRLFKKKTGTNFVEYLTALRIEKAKEFLSDPNLKVYHVAEMVGYENPRYFARLFKEATGMVPQEYRNMLTSTEVS